MQNGSNNTQKISIRSLQIFECVARTGSTIKAAEELSVTQSAISHQMKQLAQALGERLLERSGRTLKLTERGAELGRELTQAFANIGDSVNAIIGMNRNRIRLAVCSSFAEGWLAPRMTSLMSGNPAIILDVLQFGHDPELTDALADAYVTAKPVVSGFQSVELFEEKLVAVAASSVAASLHDGSVRTLISTTAGEPMRGNDWLNFAEFNCLSQNGWQPSRWLYCSHYVSALAFAESGAGVGLVPDFLAEGPLRAGRIVKAFDGHLLTGRTYRFCIKFARRNEANLAALVKWFSAGPARSINLAAE